MRRYSRQINAARDARLRRNYGRLLIYKGAVLRQTTPLSQCEVVPGVGEAPLRIATRGGNSFFAGAVAKVAVYDHELLAARITLHDQAMSGGLELSHSSQSTQESRN